MLVNIIGTALEKLTKKMSWQSTNLPVVIVGCGASGLTTLKACLEEKINVICVEKTHSIGGLWHYRDDVVEGVGAVMKSTTLNTSKEMSAFSDFPPPGHLPPYFQHSHMDEYLEMYANHFDLLQHILFRREVIHITKAKDYAQTGQWIVTIRQLDDSVDYEQRASAVFICAGMYGHPKWPQYEGLSSFKGRVMHVHGYRDAKEFEGKNVLVVGMGNSGADVAVELSRHCKNVYWSNRRGSWVVTRLGDYGKPLDMLILRRHLDWLFKKLPLNLKNLYLERRANQVCDHSLYHLKPKVRFYSQRLLINDELFMRLASGKLHLRRDVHHFTTRGVSFVDSPDIDQIVDCVVFATGYHQLFPFLDPSVLGSTDFHQMAPLYKYVFPVDMEHPTLAFVGEVVVFGPQFPVMELQARWAIQILIGASSLPPKTAMMEDIKDNKRQLLARGAAFADLPIVDYIPYMDSLADVIGAKPNLRRLALSDWTLFRHCIFGPLVAYQYRLTGVHSWSGARGAILGTEDRCWASLKPRTPDPLEINNSYRILILGTVVFCVVVFLLASCFG